MSQQKARLAPGFSGLLTDLRQLLPVALLAIDRTPPGLFSLRSLSFLTHVPNPNAAAGARFPLGAKKNRPVCPNGLRPGGGVTFWCHPLK
jgi:hypothetical protein